MRFGGSGIAVLPAAEPVSVEHHLPGAAASSRDGPDRYITGQNGSRNVNNYPRVTPHSRAAATVTAGPLIALEMSSTQRTGIKTVRQAQASQERSDPGQESEDSLASAAHASNAEAESLFRKDQFIAGRVVSRNGDAIIGAGLVATAVNLFDVPTGESVSTADLQRSALSDTAGRYRFDALLAGEYRIDAQPPPGRALGRGQLTTRTAVDFADIVLETVRHLEIVGTVADQRGQVLSGALIQPRAAGARAVFSDESGRFVLVMPFASETGTLSLRTELFGFRSKLSVISVDKNSNQVEVPVVLEPVAPTAMVSGTVRDAEGQPLTGRAVQLSAAPLSLRYSAFTDESGQFLLPAVELRPQALYELLIPGGGGYGSFVQGDLPLDAGGLDFQITLDREQTVPLRGRMVGLDGTAIGEFSMIVRAQLPPYQTVRVTSNPAGEFSLPHPPQGPLLFESHSNPRFVVAGYDATSRHDIVLTLDVGAHEIYGRIVDGEGQPVTAQRVAATWQGEAYGLRSHSSRQSTADRSGRFRFAGLGPGPHLITVEAAGYASTQVRHDSLRDGYQLDITLNAEPPG